MRYVMVFLAAVTALAITPRPAAAQPGPDPLVQAQAADVLSDFLTYAVDRTDARVNAMQEFLGQIGKQSAYTQTKPAAKQGTPLYFTQVFRGAVEFVKAGGAQYADPALKSLSESQLTDHLNTLQAYNMQQFLQLNQQRAASNSMAAYLESIGEFDNYLKWARKKFPAAAEKSQAAPSTPEQVAAGMQNLIDTARSITWQKAQAMGMSQEDFDRRWQQQLGAYRESVAKKVEGIQATGSWLTSSELGASKPPPAAPAQPPVVWQAAGAPVQPAGPSLPAPVQSKYSSAYYQSADNEINFWNGWNDGYGDVGGGHHH